MSFCGSGGFGVMSVSLFYECLNCDFVVICFEAILRVSRLWNLLVRIAQIHLARYFICLALFTNIKHLFFVLVKTLIKLFN